MGALAEALAAAPQRAATRRANLPASRKVGFAVAASALLAPLAQQTASAQETTDDGHDATTTATRSGLLRQGSRGPAVSAIQSQLGISADGVFGPATKAAVIAFQQRNGLMVDGIVGPQTRGALGGGAIEHARQQRLRPEAEPERHDRRPAEARPVRRRRVRPAVTRAAVKAFQARNGLEVDGVVGPATMAAMGISGSTAPAPTSGGGGSAVSAARAAIGTPYAYGGAAPGGFDCSGLVVYAFKQAGVSLPRTSFAQFGAGARGRPREHPGRRPRVLQRERAGRVARGHRDLELDRHLRHDARRPGARDQRLLLGLALRRGPRRGVAERQERSRNSAWAGLSFSRASSTGTTRPGRSPGTPACGPTAAATPSSNVLETTAATSRSPSP